MTPPQASEAAVGAVQFPVGADLWNRANRGAYRKGWEAFVSGVGRDECPYEDHRKPSGRLSWSRSFINAWRDGYDAARTALQAPTP